VEWTNAERRELACEVLAETGVGMDTSALRSYKNIYFFFSPRKETKALVTSFSSFVQISLTQRGKVSPSVLIASLCLGPPPVSLIRFSRIAQKVTNLEVYACIEDRIMKVGLRRRRRTAETVCSRIKRTILLQVWPEKRCFA